MTIPPKRLFQIITSFVAILANLAMSAVESHGGERVAGAPLSRHRRHILQLCQLVSVHTNRACYDFNNYGCFCGLGSADSQPVDAVDSCCRSHDHCYANNDCFWLYPHFVGYEYECTSGGCKCTDAPKLSPCSYSTCKCDMKLARCLARSEFNSSFSSYDRDQCLEPEAGRNSRKKKSVKKMKARRLVKKQQRDNSKEKTAKRKQQQVVLA